VRPGTHVVFDGQSLNNSPSATSFPAQLMSGRTVPWSNVAINGTAVDALATTAPARRDPVLQHTATSVLVFVGGQSDLVLNDSAATLLADLESYATASRAAGADKIIMSTIPPSTGYTAPQEAVRVAVNPLILASSAFDAVIDLATATNLTDASNITYYADGLHWTTAGALAAATAAAPVLTSVLATLA
jgi:hypothetical protein